MFEALDTALDCPKSMTLAFGVAGIGKTEMARRWCDMHPGVARYVEVPGVANARAFYAAIAEQLGIEVGKSYNPEIISLRVIEVLKRNRLMLVLDEAQRLWPCRNRPTASPLRIVWLTSLVNAGVPLGMVCMPEFFKWKQVFVEFTNWSSTQFDRRLTMIQALPARPCRDDLRGVARHLLPKGSTISHELLVSYAEASKTGLSAITGTVEAARLIAKKAGRSEASHADIQKAIRDVRAPMDCILAADPAHLAAQADFSSSAKPRRRPLGKARAKHMQMVCMPPAANEVTEDFSCAEREVVPPQAHRLAVAPSPAAS